MNHQKSGSTSENQRRHRESSEAASHDPTWTFARGSDELTVVRPANTDRCTLVVTLNDAPRTYVFRDESALLRFQTDMESLLTHTGWSFVGFLPERRFRRDRRALPRINERRRWWTDGWLFVAK